MIPFYIPIYIGGSEEMSPADTTALWIIAGVLVVTLVAALIYLLVSGIKDKREEKKFWERYGMK